MSNYEEHFLKVINFLKLYEKLIDCHLVDFLTEDLWENCLPRDFKLYLETNGNNIFRKIEQFNELTKHEDSKLYTFLRNVKALKLESCQNIITRCDFLNVLNYENAKVYKTIPSEFMKVKKCHEVDVFTKTIVWLNQNKSSVIIDAGAGKGYSSLYLSNYYNLPVLCIECSLINHNSAILHRSLVNKKNKRSTSLINYAVEQIDETTDFVQLVKNYFPNLHPQRELVMTALHACGSLTDSVIKSFLNVSDIRCLCIVPCCYHFTSKSLSSLYEFSKNSRMLAQQSTDRINHKNEFLSPSLFYRAVLQVVFRLLGIKNTTIGRGAPLDNFLIYAKWALKKVNAKEVPTDEILEKTYEEFKDYKWKFNIFQLLRIQLAPVVEAAIILDKILFIHKFNICTKLEVVQLFDPLLSPRNWAIIATK
ncbi:PREDICTED: methyltransferase-like protein 25 [Ceratosolen solmsi marchali]|uniref:Methyltransferase-like protein 25 n=1 Tax=Ceratosolen solmsi marchali TaxID=326594 RepID=A0AAJ6YG19_9HYME|nr:PREDICTED: methyltransferase-like protein 25 [Ceratosolen solmsi marchali]